MIKQKPVFVEGNILTKEMLSAITEFAYAYPMCLYTGYCDGIISGFSITTTNEMIQIGQGLVCFSGEVFVFSKMMEIPLFVTEEEVYLKLCYGGASEKRSHIAYEFSLQIDAVLPKENELELCRFRLQNDAKLRDRHVDFEDMNTEYDTVNILHTLVASAEVATLQLAILKRFAMEMMETFLEETVDIQFCMQILSANEPIPLYGISAYLHFKLSLPFEIRTHIAIYEYLRKIVESERGKGRTGKTKLHGGKRKIMIE